MSQEPEARDAEVAEFRAAVLNKLTYAVGKDPEHAFDHDWFEAIALAARDHMVDTGWTIPVWPTAVARSGSITFPSSSSSGVCCTTA